MITRSEIREMILSEAAAARRELSERSPTRLTRERLQQIVLEEVAAVRAHHPSASSARLSLMEAMYGDGVSEGGPGLILSDPGSAGMDCKQCGARHSAPVAKCPHCGASMMEYMSRGTSGIGKLSGVDEAKKKRKSMTHPAPKDDPSDLGGMTQDTARSMVAKLARAPGPTFSNVADFAKDWGAENPAAYAGTLMRSAGMEPSRGPKKKGKKKG
jgi:hypothetical protein